MKTLILSLIKELKLNSITKIVDIIKIKYEFRKIGKLLKGKAYLSL